MNEYDPLDLDRRTLRLEKELREVRSRLTDLERQIAPAPATIRPFTAAVQPPEPIVFGAPEPVVQALPETPSPAIAAAMPAEAPELPAPPLEPEVPIPMYLVTRPWPEPVLEASPAEHALETAAKEVERERVAEPTLHAPLVTGTGAATAHGQSDAKPAVPPLPPIEPPRPPLYTPAPEPISEGPSIDWEQVLGRRGALWMGTALVFLAAAFFLSWAWAAIGAWGQVTTIALIGAGFVAAAEWSSTRVERTFSAGLAGVGLAVLYLDVWAAVQRYNPPLVPMEAGLAVMVLFVGVGVFLAMRYDVQALSLFATVGGFLTPALLSSGSAGEGSPVPLLSYLTILIAGVLAVSLRKEWPALAWTAFIADILVVAGWASGHYAPGMYGVVFAYITIHYLLFVGSAAFRGLVQGAESDQYEAILTAVSSLIYFGAGEALLSGHLGQYPAALAVALLVFYGLMAWGVSFRAPENNLLRQTSLGLSALFATVAIPVQLREAWSAVGWSALAGVLYALATGRDRQVFRSFAVVVWALALAATAVRWFEEGTSQRVLLSGPALSLLTFAAVSALIAWLATRRRDDGDSLVVAAGSAAVLTGAMLVARETVLGLQLRSPAFAAIPGGVLYVVAIALGLFAMASYATGLAARMAPVRFSAVSVAAIAVASAMLASVSENVYDGGSPAFVNVRFACYIVLGVVLATVARLAARSEQSLGADERTAMGWLGLAVNGLALWSVSLEIAATVGPPRQPDAFLAPNAAFIIATLWSVYAIGLIYLGTEWERGLMRGLGYAVGVVSIGLLIEGSMDSVALTWTPVLNTRFLAFAAATAMLLVTARGSKDLGGEADGVSEYAALAAPALSLVGLTMETALATRYWMGAGASLWQLTALMLVSVLWSVFAMGLMVLGRRLGREAVRNLGFLIGAAGILLLAKGSADSVDTVWMPILNVRFAAYAVACVMLLVAGIRASEEQAGPEGMASAYAPLAAAVLALLGLTLETTLVARTRLAAPGGGEWVAPAAALVSLLWSFASVWLLRAGVQRGAAWRVTARFIALGALVAVLLATAAGGLTGTPVLNLRFLGFVVAAGMLLYHAMAEAEGEADSETDCRRIALMAAPVTILLGLSHEIFVAGSTWLGASDPDWPGKAWLTVSMLWSAFAMGFGWFGASQPLRAFRYLAYAVGAVSVGILVVTAAQSGGAAYGAIVNPRSLAYVMAIATIILFGQLRSEDTDEFEATLPGPMTIAAAVLALVGLTQETVHAVTYLGGVAGDPWTKEAQMAVSVLWTAYGAALLGLGINYHSRMLRLMALGLLGITSCKVFLSDLSNLDTPYRVLSFGALGLTLIGISWLYTRYGIGEEDEHHLPPTGTAAAAGGTP